METSRASATVRELRQCHGEMRQRPLKTRRRLEDQALPVPSITPSLCISTLNITEPLHQPCSLIKLYTMAPLDEEIDIGQMAISKYPEVPAPQPKPEKAPSKARPQHRRIPSLAKSPSTPDLKAESLAVREIPMSARNTAWAKTLSRNYHGPPLRHSQLDDLPVDPEKLQKMRRWILGLAVGE